MPCERKGWFKELVDSWAENTTLHGVRFIASQHYSNDIPCIRQRRFIWLIVVLASTALLTQQITERVIYYWKRPISVSVEIYNNHTVRFPTITICNQNSFKMTRAVENELFYTLSELYLNRTSNFHYNSQNSIVHLPMNEIFNKTSFTIDDMLLECKWLGQPCFKENFTQTFTDHGICFSFNANEPFLKVDDTAVGSGNGLVLLLNIQQYEYIPEPFGSSGIRFLTHEPGIVPLVTDLGQAAATGTHTFVGMKVKTTINSALPKGKCGANENYNYDNCFLNCRTKFYLKECECREIYMPDITGSSRICTLEEQFNCVKRVKQEFAIKKHECECPVNCQEIDYEPSLSLFSISSQDKHNMHDEKQLINKLEQSYVYAKDVASVVIDNIKEEDKSMLQYCLQSIEVTMAYLKRIYKKIKTTEDMFKRDINNLRRQLSKKIAMIKEQEIVVNKMFVDGYLSAKERTLELVSHRFYEFEIHIQSYLEELRTLRLGEDDSHRRMIAFDGKVTINQREKCAVAAYSKVNELYDNYLNGKLYWPDRLPRGFTSQKVNSVMPRLLLSKVLFGANERYNWNASVESLNTLIECYRDMKEMLNVTLKTGHYSQENYSTIRTRFFEASKIWDHFRSTILDRIFIDPYKTILSIKENAKRILDELDLDHLQGSPNFATISSNVLNVTNDTTLMQIHHNISQYLLYQDNVTFPREMKYMKSSFCITLVQNMESIQACKDDVVNVVEKIRLYRLQWPQRLEAFQLLSAKVWRLILSDVDAFSQYEFHNYTDWLNRNKLETMRNIFRHLDSMLKQVECRRDVNSCNHRGIEQGLSALMILAQDYVGNTKVNAEVLQNNILRLEFFYRHLRFEKIVKQWSYLFTALLSDIGGTLGLFVGGSILSIVEILDLIGLMFCHAHGHSSKRQPETQILCRRGSNIEYSPTNNNSNCSNNYYPTSYLTTSTSTNSSIKLPQTPGDTSLNNARITTAV